ncbi:hypothetical protein JCM19298_2502 [Nonlabens ulvanivorans]|nr:hypothetical protein [Nonlabens ulvanivorans]GAK92014.1 hypothetical protein JCM19298_2502 [Nonlabens ulvanivorans]
MRILLSLLVLLTCLQANSQDFTSTAKEFLKQNKSQYQIDIQDINELQVTTSSFSKSLNAQTVYISQFYQGIEIASSSSMFLIRDNVVISATISFEKIFLIRLIRPITSLSP